MGESTQNNLPFNPAVLSWARNRCGLSVAEAANKINVTEEKISKWETGSAIPTVIQGRKLAHIYDRPSAKKIHIVRRCGHTRFLHHRCT